MESPLPAMYTTTLYDPAARGGVTHAIVDVVAVVMEHKLFATEGRLSQLVH